MAQDYLKSGEYITALPHAPYFRTTNGYTARCCIDQHSNLTINAYYRNGSYQGISWQVDPNFFIPYSDNMETAGFERFVIYGKEGDKDETEL